MRLTRKQLLGGAAAGALGAAGIYELVDQLAESPERAAAGELPPEQHLLPGLKVVESEGVEVIEPPLHHQLVTARLKVPNDRGALLEARDVLEGALQELEGRYEGTPVGLATTVAWGLPYFRRYVPGPRASTSRSTAVPRRAGGACPRSSTPCASRATRRPPSSRRTTLRSCCAATPASTSPTARSACSRTPAGCSS